MLTQDQKHQIEQLSGKLSDFKIAKKLKLDPEAVKSHLKSFRDRQSIKRDRVFRTIMFLLPAIIILVAELTLRGFNYGGNLSLFQPVEDNPEYLKINKNAGRRYFSSIRVVPESSNDAFTAKKRENSYRIFVMGGSSAIGYPYMHNGSLSKMLFQRLVDYFPDKELEVVNLGMTAINSFSLLNMIDEVLAQNPDALILYTGHNEFYGALGAGSTESLGGHRSIINLYLKLQQFKLMFFLRDQITNLKNWLFGDKGENKKNQSTLMSRMVGNSAIEYDSDTYNRARDFYKANLTDIINRAKHKNVRVLLCNLVSNLKDQSPFVSLFDEGTDQKEFEQTFNQASNLAQAGKMEQALEIFQSLLQNDSKPAKLHYRMAKCYEALGNYDNAKEAYIKAKDLDGLRFRASSDFNLDLAEIAREHSVALVDFEKTFQAESPNGLVGNNLMVEHLHPNLEGYFLMGRTICNYMKENGFIEKNWDENKALPDSDYWNARGVTDLDEEIVRLRIQLLTQNWPFVQNKNYIGLNPTPKNQLEEIALDAWHRDITWEEAHVKIAEFYTKNRDFENAAREYEALILETPYNVSPYLRAGLLYVELKDYNRAYDRLSKSIELEETATANKMLGSLLIDRNQPKDGIPYLQKSLIMNPNDKQALYNLTGAYLLLKDKENARQNLRKLEQIAPKSKEVSILKYELSKLGSV